MVCVGTRPRLGRIPNGSNVLQRADAPRLFALLDRVAAAAGTRTAETVVVNAAVNAYVAEVGWRRRRVVGIGLPLWTALTPQQRIALLSHEFGHYANGDPRHGAVVHTALSTLASWDLFLLPGVQLRRSTLESIARAVMYVPRGIVLAVLWVMDRLTLRASQRAEYRADAVAARIGSSQAAAGMLDVTLTAGSVGMELRRLAILARTGNRGANAADITAGLWERLAARSRAVTPHERDRLRRVGAARGHGTDSTHPPTHLRPCWSPRPPGPRPSPRTPRSPPRSTPSWPRWPRWPHAPRNRPCAM